ncbi:FadR/GntR family transcriptional regulator [Paraburkholderia rhynchosiae]|uniref:GntR family transcriptional regulator n=1 Tax=Paraburkholderia rhynchosiae TaxID=487049 RepID=A0A2N7W6U5_9BURK|nr:FadR/GntR family transcriptional regulator [Paraburkholderia rhynchosiae]PMS25133.1 GntR family transcriptional regulator [Paraburkholderia rhynchosiae]CAB3714867.1 Putative L-lactate dehydrogenase operon regulatory protein [Paraburkholderia rhynchosiae]
MELKSVQPRRLYHLIGDQIRAYIAVNHLSTGDRLPPERDLAQQLNVSRPSVREALIALEIQGVVEIRMGAGVFVRSIAPVPEALRDKIGDSPSDIMQARASIEGCVASLACARLTEEGIARLHGLVADMRRSIAEGSSPVEADRQFHICIAEIAQNAVFTRLVSELFDERHAPIAEKLRMQTENASTWSAALIEHEMIVAALVARDPLEAQAAMRSHLKASEARWIGALNPGS